MGEAKQKMAKSQEMPLACGGVETLGDPWGGGGYPTRDLHRYQLAARAVVLIDNGWSRFLRLALPEARREAITLTGQLHLLLTHDCMDAPPVRSAYPVHWRCGEQAGDQAFRCQRR